MKDVIVNNWGLLVLLFIGLTGFLIWLNGFITKDLDKILNLKQSHDEHEDFPGT